MDFPQWRSVRGCFPWFRADVSLGVAAAALIYGSSPPVWGLPASTQGGFFPLEANFIVITLFWKKKKKQLNWPLWGRRLCICCRATRSVLQLQLRLHCQRCTQASVTLTCKKKNPIIFFPWESKRFHRRGCRLFTAPLENSQIGEHQSAIARTWTRADSGALRPTDRTCTRRLSRPARTHTHTHSRCT